MRTTTNRLIPFALLLPVMGMTVAANADTLYVNNDTAFPAEYRTFDDAYAAAAAGDTIMLAGSAISYGDIKILTKPIKLVGNGFSTAGPPSVQQRADSLSTIVDTVYVGNDASNIYYNDMSELPGAATNQSEISGISSDSIYLWSDQCVISRCYIDSFFKIFGDTNVISGCRLSCNMNFQAATLDPNRASTGSLIRNTIWNNGQIGLGPGLGLGASASFSQCIFGFKGNTQIDTILRYSGFSDGNGVLENCIIGDPNFSYFYENSTYRNATLYHCLLVSNQPVTIPPYSANNGNITTTDIAGVFETGYRLAAGSPALGVGENGEDLGIYGGEIPFVEGGIPAIPLIQKLRVLSADPTTGLKFRVTAEAQD